MGRSSRADADRHKTEVLKAAVRFVAEHDPGALTIPKAMSAAGMTPGGFYNYFTSKDDFLSQVVDLAFAMQHEAVGVLGAAHSNQLRPTISALAAVYLTSPDRRDMKLGISVLVLSSEISESAPETATRQAFARGIDGLVALLAGLQSPGETPGQKRKLVLATLSALAGASAIARALPDRVLASDLLDATRLFMQTRPSE